MSRSRFRYIKEVFRFDDIDTRDERKTPENQGKLAPISKIFDLFLDACSVNFSPGRDLTVDESIDAFKGRCSFKIFMPSKPDRYGIKIWSMVDSKTSYLWNAEIYQGKTSNKRETGQAERVVKQLVKGRGEQTIEHTGRTITADNFFTSVKLAKYLLNAGVSFLGTLRKNKPEIPQCFQASKERIPYSTEFGFSKQERMMISSYVPKKNKAVLMLSTKHYDKETEDTPPHKPKTILDYN